MVGNGRIATWLIVLSVSLHACVSGYQPTDAGKQGKGRGIKWLKGKTDSIAIMLEGDKDRTPDNFSVTLIIPKIAKVDSLALSDVRVELTEAGEPPDRYVLQRIEFYRYPSSGPRIVLETITGSRVSEKQHFELSENGRYVLLYFFSRGAMRRYPTKVTVHLEAGLSKKGTSETFRESLDFRRHSEFSPFH